MKHTNYLSLRKKTIFLFAFAWMISACHKDQSYHHGGGSGNSSVHIFLSDDPSLVFDNLFIDIQKVEIKVEDHDQLENEREHQEQSDDNDNHGDNSGGWITLDFKPGVFDILSLRNGIDTLLATANFPSANQIRKVRLTLGNNNSIVLNGQSFPLFPKDDKNIVVIKLDDDFAPAGSFDQLDFTLDFDAGLSVRNHGDRFELDSHIKAFRKEKAGSIEGRVLPAAANAVVIAVNGTDTTTAKPETEGEFKIVGLKPGNYSVVFHATANNYLDTVIQNVNVSMNEDAHLGTVTLHQ
ncbi:MAG TPA: DUF4382 domain-containing protein [Puia sp.]|nr:DUF4382 domain-containing protein [Puia sp.]